MAKMAVTPNFRQSKQTSISCGSEGRIWVLIASVPDLCIRFTFMDAHRAHIRQNIKIHKSSPDDSGGGVFSLTIKDIRGRDIGLEYHPKDWDRIHDLKLTRRVA